MILDINDLKQINDTQGHQTGDQYIQGACRIICDIFRDSRVFRIGGDEFSVLVQGDDYAHIDERLFEIAKHNREAVLTNGIVIACGMAKFDNDSCMRPVLVRADRAMYENKTALKAMQKQNL